MTDEAVEREAVLYRNAREMWKDHSVNLDNVNFEQWLMCRGLIDASESDTRDNKVILLP
jgi:hypothetical protein